MRARGEIKHEDQVASRAPNKEFEVARNCVRLPDQFLKNTEHNAPSDKTPPKMQNESGLKRRRFFVGGDHRPLPCTPLERKNDILL